MSKRIYKESTLDNGLKIITSENKDSEIVTFSVVIRVGGRNGLKDQLGYAHFLEHMMMRGSEKYPSVFEISVAKDRVGASSNAVTGQERIMFFIQVSKNHMEKMFELLADSILNSKFDPIIFENEKKVIIQEINRSNDENLSRLWKKSMEEAFQYHPLSRNTLGDYEAVSSVTIEGLKDFYESFFCPNNSAIITSGGATHEEILELSRKYLGNWISKDAVSSFQAVEVFNRCFFEKSPSKQIHLSFCYVGPKANFKESATLEILETYLGYGQSSVLYQELRHKNGLVYSVSASNHFFQDANLFYIRTSTTNPKEVVTLMSALMKDIEPNFTKKIFDELREQALSIFRRKLDNSINELNFLIDSWRLYGRIVTPEDFIEEIKNVSYDDVLVAKNKFLSANSLSIVAIGEEDPF